MAQTGFTPIQLYNSPTAGVLPTAGNLALGELAINTTDENLYFKNTGGLIRTVGANLVANLSGKNVLINGDMSISQINGTTPVSPAVTTGYVIDMWDTFLSQPSKLNFQQVTSKLNSLGAPFAELITTASAYTALSTDAFNFYQPIEGLNFDRFFYGSANAKAASLQFKANASVAGTYSGSIANVASTRSYVFTFVLAANTDTLVTIQNIPGDTSGTWVGASSAASMLLRFDLGSGSTFRSSTINAWQSGNIVGATGSVSLVATAGANLSISEVQFELGPVCTAYERKLVSQSLAECQRYYQTGLVLSQSIAQSYVGCSLIFPVVMRASPSVIFSDSLGNVNRFTNSTTNNLTFSAGGLSSNTYSLYLNAISSTTLLGNTYWYINWIADARL
jgi:hypothetical protein